MPSICPIAQQSTDHQASLEAKDSTKIVSDDFSHKDSTGKNNP